MRIQVRVYFFFLWGLVCIYLTALGRMHRHIESPTLPANKRDVFSCQADGKEYKIMKIPQFIIAGTQKGGTSALYGFLKKHPKIVSATSFEPHFFDRQTAIFKRHRGGLRNDENLCRARATYQQDHFDQSFLHRNPDVLSFEKTPSYMVLDEVPARIRRVAPWAKIILTLRNPVDRCFSHHKMSAEWGRNLTLEERLGEDIYYLQQEGNFTIAPDPPFPVPESMPPKPGTPWRGRGVLYRGMYARHLKSWLKHFELGRNLLIVRYEQLQTNPASVFNKILDFVGAPSHVLADHHMEKRYGPKPAREDIVLSNATRAYLERFYEPYQRELADLLGAEWFKLG